MTMIDRLNLAMDEAAALVSLRVPLYRVQCDDCGVSMLRANAGRWVCGDCADGRGFDVRNQARGTVAPMGDVVRGGGDWA